MMFRNTEHENFYNTYIGKCKNDVYHKALIYTLGISDDTRSHIASLFDFDTDSLKMNWLNSGWLTSTDKKIILLAFDLFNCGQPTIEFTDADKKLNEAREYAPSNIFSCEYAKYFIEALNIRYESEISNDFDTFLKNLRAQGTAQPQRKPRKLLK